MNEHAATAAAAAAAAVTGASINVGNNNS